MIPKKITFPDKGILKDTAVPEYQTSAQGRNGYVKQAGLEVFHSPVGVIRLSPITSKGTIANCCVEIPNTPEVVNQVIEALKTEPKKRSAKYEKIQARIDAARGPLGQWAYDDEGYPREDWVFEVSNRDTQLGYFDWLTFKYEAEEESGN